MGCKMLFEVLWIGSLICYFIGLALCIRMNTVLNLYFSGIILVSITSIFMIREISAYKSQFSTSTVKRSELRGNGMKYCSKCGEELLEEAVICPHCGCRVGNFSLKDDPPSTGLNVLAFLLPLVGLILFIVYSDKEPAKAKAIGKWSLIGFIIGAVSYGALYGILLGSLL